MVVYLDFAFLLQHQILIFVSSQVCFIMGLILFSVRTWTLVPLRPLDELVRGEAMIARAPLLVNQHRLILEVCVLIRVQWVLFEASS